MAFDAKRSLALWRRRLAFRERKHRYYHHQSNRPDAERKALATKWHRLADAAAAMVARREQQIAKPRFIISGLSCSSPFGELGPELYVTGHHTAGRKDTSVEDALRLCSVYHDAHKAKGWGGIGYHYCIARDGTIIGLRPTISKGAHVGGRNSNNVGVMCHGTTGDMPTAAQAKSFAWLLANAHTSNVPARHRTDRDLRDAKLFGHNDWPGHGSNACPGTHKTMFRSGGASR